MTVQPRLWKILPAAILSALTGTALSAVLLESDSPDTPIVQTNSGEPAIGMSLQTPIINNESNTLPTDFLNTPFSAPETAQSPYSGQAPRTSADPFREQDSPAALTRQAEASVQRGDMELAAAYAWQAVRREPSPDRAFLLARMLMACSDYENAGELFMAIQQRNEQYPDIDFFIAEALYLSGKTTQSTEWFEKAQTASTNHQEIIQSRLDELLKPGSVSE